MSEFKYPGEELDVFETAENWKAYWALKLKPFLRGNILEVGAGIGANTNNLMETSHASWHCLEPDRSLYEKILQKRESGAINPLTKVSQCTALELEGDGTYDSILYIDVLEHIEDDLGELKHAASLLNATGSVIILSPAHNWLYSEFDKKIGHFRRYDKGILRKIVPAGMRIVHIQYLDSIGLFASLANKLIMKTSSPSPKQISFWDSVMIPLSRVADPLLLNSVGKSIFAVLQRDDSQ